MILYFKEGITINTEKMFCIERCEISFCSLKPLVWKYYRSYKTIDSANDALRDFTSEKRYMKKHVYYPDGTQKYVNYGEFQYRVNEVDLKWFKSYESNLSVDKPKKSFNLLSFFKNLFK